MCDWSWWPDLNRRPADYESAALPTEPHQQVEWEVSRIPREIYYTRCKGKCQPFFSEKWEKPPVFGPAALNNAAQRLQSLLFDARDLHLRDPKDPCSLVLRQTVEEAQADDHLLPLR